MFSTVAPERQPGGYYPGGAPVNVPSALSPYTGAVAATPFDVKESDIERDTPGKRSNATVQYARIVVARGDLAQAETADLERVGALAMLCAYNPPGMFGGDGETLFYGVNMANPSSTMRQMIERLGSTPGLTGKGVNKPSRLVSYNYLTTLVAPSLDSLPGLNQMGLDAYIAVFGNGVRSRITHMINLGTASANNYDNAGINLDPTIDQFQAFINQMYNANGNPGLPLSATARAFMNAGFELDANKMLESPYLLPAGYCAYAKTSFITTTESWPKMGATSACLPDILQMRANTNATSELVSSQADDVRNALYNALFYNERGLMSPVGVGPWRPDGFVIYKYSTFGMDKEAERALDAQQNALYNIAIGGQTLVSELSSLMLSKDPVGAKFAAATSVYERATQRLKLNQRRMTMPGDMVYLLIIGQVTRDAERIAPDTSGSKAASMRNGNNNNRLTNIRFELSTSEELSRGSTPKKAFGYNNGQKACFFDTVNSDQAPTTPQPNSIVLDYDTINANQKNAGFANTAQENVLVALKAALNPTNPTNPDFSSRILNNTVLYDAIVALGTAMGYNTLDKVYFRFTGEDVNGNPVTKYDVVSIATSMKSAGFTNADLVTTAKVEHARLVSLALADNEVIVGGWQLGRVIDSAATRAIANGSSQVSNMDGTFGLNVVVEIRPVTGLQLHQRYWSRTGVEDL